MRKGVRVFFLLMISAILLSGCVKEDSHSQPKTDELVSENESGVQYETEHIHEYKELKVPPTCTDNGYTFFTCSCGAEYYDKFPALGHDIEVLVAVEPSCKEPGKTEGSRCKRCGEVLIAQIDLPEAHVLGEMIIAKEPTCTEPGLKEARCKLCEKVLETEDIPANGHRAWDWTTDTPATCISCGTAHLSCTVCGLTLEEKTLPLTGHTAAEWIIDKEASCTDVGHKHTECVICKTLLESAEVPKKNHNYGSWATVSVGSCNTGGTEKRTCSVCGATETRTTPVGNHIYENGICVVCGAIDPIIGTLLNPLPARNNFVVPFRPYAYLGTSYEIRVWCTGLSSGTDIDALIASENRFNPTPSEKQEWRIFVFGLACISSANGDELEAYQLFNENNYYTSLGAKLPVYDSAVLGSQYGPYSASKVSLFPGGQGTVVIGLLVDKSVGDMYLKIPSSNGQVWLSCTP